MSGRDSPIPWALAIETSNPSSHDDAPAAGVAGRRLESDAVADRGPGEIVEIPLAPGARHDDGLMPAIEALRARLGVGPGDLERVCVSIGPGGYTGLRVAVTTAKSIAETTGAAVVGVPSAAVAAANSGLEPPFAVCLASKRGATHVTVFKGCTSAEPGTISTLLGVEVGLIDAEGLEPLGVRFLIADRFLPDGIRRRAAQLGIGVQPPRFTAVACLELGLCLDQEPIEKLAPAYARVPEAVRLWKVRHQA
ncbi:MAG: tRNA (adenosine(37)-N6)-threonylcarbamoyltransferase complex dimerization subunit type 1 TsaB [Phycisphaeraceae bacterium]|nr:MAG: tRNA (adenosine(37)-N6)-threonylcarbamoyltransferase complex dimerization subunit type 1 TsaB [Phycisphaeraceae bacterium]